MDKRDKAKAKSDTTGLKSNKSEYNKLRNKVTSLVRKHNKKRIKDKITKATDTGDPRKIWDMMKKVIGYASPGPPTKLLDNGKLVKNQS